MLATIAAVARSIVVDRSTRMLVTMRRRVWLLIMAALPAGSVLPVAVSGSVVRLANVTRAVCGPGSARTLARDTVARVYASGGHVYGCVAGATRSYQLGATGYSITAAHIEAVAVAARIAAYGRRTIGVDTGYTTVTVRRLATGTLLAQRPATTRIGVEGFQSIDSLVLKADGAVAWIATARSIGKPTFVRQLGRLDQQGFQLLDSGPNVAAASLALHGSTLSWRHGTANRTTRLH